jgi:hypothetical protein
MSALRPIATIEQTWREVRFVPATDSVANSLIEPEGQ